MNWGHFSMDGVLSLMRMNESEDKFTYFLLVNQNVAVIKITKI